MDAETDEVPSHHKMRFWREYFEHVPVAKVLLLAVRFRNNPALGHVGCNRSSDRIFVQQLPIPGYAVGIMRTREMKLGGGDIHFCISLEGGRGCFPIAGVVSV